MTKAEFRPDLEGLRGIAVALVVLFHAGLLGVGGGFIGVDAFYVMSGFLITGILLDTRNEPRRWSRFFARRALRIFPLYYAIRDTFGHDGGAPIDALHAWDASHAAFGDGGARSRRTARQGNRTTAATATR
jgi:hypothetical protein